MKCNMCKREADQYVLWSEGIILLCPRCQRRYWIKKTNEQRKGLVGFIQKLKQQERLHKQGAGVEHVSE